MLMPRRRCSVALTDAACEVEYQEAVRRLSQALPILAEIARRVDAADKAICRPPVIASENLKDKANPFAVTERHSR